MHAKLKVLKVFGLSLINNYEYFISRVKNRRSITVSSTFEVTLVLVAPSRGINCPNSIMYYCSVSIYIHLCGRNFNSNPWNFFLSVVHLQKRMLSHPQKQIFNQTILLRMLTFRFS